MIYPNIAEYEENDSQLARLTIAGLHEEINRLNNIINELEKWLKEQKEWNDTEYPREYNDYGDVLEKLQELKRK